LLVVVKRGGKLSRKGKGRGVLNLLGVGVNGSVGRLRGKEVMAG